MEKRGKKRGRRSDSSNTQLAESLHSETSRDSNYTTSAAMTSSTETGERAQIGRIYLVRSINGQWLPAKILETRQTADRIEYFVHFENRN